MNAMCLYRFGNWCHQRHIPMLPKLMRNAIYFIFHAYIPSSASIGEGTVFGYRGLGQVIHSNAVIGKRCMIGHRVTIGTSVGYTSATPVPCPQIGDDCFLGADAKILGGITIGNRCTVGAGALVLMDLPDGAIAVGAPARIIGQNPPDYLALRA